ncbi:MAG: DUF1080 domain-containing protein [Acidobacteria bacterium]|nr:DUF1080 domain-containing protein [Acidobacteriota bacterium]
MRTFRLPMFAAAVAAATLAAGPSLSAQAGQWKVLFDGKDLSQFTILAGGGGGRRGAPAPTAPPSANPTDRGWKVETGVITSTAPAEGQRSGSLATKDSYKDFEFETEFMLAESGTRCTPKLGPKQENLSEDRPCTFNSGIYFRNGYQLNLGRREAGEYIGVVVHRQLPEAIRGNVDWLSTGDCGGRNHVYLQDCDQFAKLRKVNDWNKIRIRFQGTRLQVWLNDVQITDVTDDPTDPAEASWKDAAPIWFQTPPAGESGGFAGYIKHRNVRVRAL